MRVLVVHDHVPEHAPPDALDNLTQARAVGDALASLGYTVDHLPFTLDLASMAGEIARLEPNLIFNLVESIDGKGQFLHLAPALFDGLRTPYTGCPTEALFLTGNKILTKRRLQLAGVATPPWFSLKDPDERFIPGAPWIVKAVWEDASIGLDASLVRPYGSAAELRHAIVERTRELGFDFFAEEYIDGREFNVGLLAGPDGPQTLPVTEFRFVDFPAGAPRILDYKAKWHEETPEYANTVRTFDIPPADAPLVERLRATALRVWNLFDLHGYARVDFRVDPDGIPWLLEVNANPCLSPDSGFVAMADRAGLSFADVVERIVQHGIVTKY